MDHIIKRELNLIGNRLAQVFVWLPIYQIMIEDGYFKVRTNLWGKIKWMLSFRKRKLCKEAAEVFQLKVKITLS